jgi:hypothetical protein
MRTLHRTVLAASTALSLSFVGYSPEAFQSLPVGSNLDFTSLSGPGAPKSCFSGPGCANPTGWTGGTGLIFIANPALGHSAATGGYLTTYGDPVGNIPGNYVEADGNPFYESGFQRSISGLTPGQTYTLSFYQGASQQTNFFGATTNQWYVSLGTSGLFTASGANPSVPDNSCGTNCVPSNSDPTASIAASQLMGPIPSGNTVGWEFVSVNLTADATTDLLSFLAWGNNGNTTNLPPIAFLAGVNAPPGILPEPASMGLVGVGLAGLGAVARRRRGKRSTLN